MSPPLSIRTLIGVVLLPLVLALSACATAGVSGDGEGSVALRVENNLIPPSSLTIWAVPDTGARTLVGTVDPSDTATLTFDPVSAGTQYQFVAETVSGGEIVSNPVFVSDGAVAEWDLTANIATVVNEG